MNKKSFLVFGTVLLALLLPILYLFWKSIQTDTGISLLPYIEMLRNSGIQIGILYTFGIGIVSAFFSLLLGGALAFLMAYTNIGKRKLILFFLHNFFLIPSYILAFAWNEMLHTLFSVNLYSASGMVFIFTLCGIPIAYSFLYHAMKELPAEAVHASRNAGYSMLQSILNIDFAALKFSFFAAFVLVLLFCVDNFSIAAFLGIPAKIPMLSTLIYEQITSSGDNSFANAAVLSVLTGGIIVFLLVLERVFTKQFWGNQQSNQKEPMVFFSPKKKKWIEVLLLSILVLLQIVPFFFLLSRSLTTRYLDMFHLDKLTLQNYLELLGQKEIYQTFFRSFRISLLSAIICLGLAFFCIGGQMIYGRSYLHWIERVAAVFYALPGIVVALAVLYFWTSFGEYSVYFYHSAGLLMLAYISRFLMVGLRGVRVAFYSLGKEAFESAMMVDISRIRRFFQIIFPPMKQQIFYTFFLLFIPMMNEVTLSAILSTATNKTIGLSIFNLQQAGEDFKAYALSVCVMIFNVLWIGLGMYLTRGESYGIDHSKSVKKIRG